MSIITSVRPANFNDVDAIAQIHASCWREVYSFLPISVHEIRSFDYRRGQWLEFLSARQRGAALIVLEQCGRTIGFAVSKPNADTAIDVPGEFHACYILPDCRGGDAGPVAMRALAEHLRAEDCWPACVWAFRENPYRRIYPALGCQPVVFRDRVIAGHPVPEIGYKVPEYDTLINRLETMIVSAALRRTG